MKLKKILSLILAAMMLISVFAGCNQTPQASDDTQQPTSTEPSASDTNQPEVTQEPPAPPADELTEDELTSQIGDAVTTAAREVTLPLTEEKETLSIYMKQMNLRPPLSDLGLNAWSDFEFAQKLEEMTNVHIVYNEANFMTFMEQFNLYIAAGEWDDMVLGLAGVYAGGNAKAFDDEVVVDLTSYLEECAPNYSYYMNNVGTFSRDFKIDGGYIVDMKSFYDTYRRNNGLVIRKDWLDEQGLDVPTTYDQMTNALEVFKTEYGCEQPFYLSSTATTEGLTGGFGVALGGQGGPAVIQIDGVVQCPILEDSMLDYVSLLQDWYNKGLIYSDYMSQVYDPFSSDISNGVGSDNIGVWGSLYEEIEKYRTYNDNPNFEMSPVPNLVINEGEVEHVSSRLVVDQDSMSITTQCDNVELAVKWMDFWYSDAGVLMLNYGVEGTTYDLVDGKPVFTDLVVNNDFGLSVSSYMRCQCPYGSFAGIYSPMRIADHMTELELSAWDAWTNSGDGLYAMPSGISLTASESEELATIQTDVQTAIDESFNLFVIGAKPMSEWDSFIDLLKTLRIDRIIEIQQNALDRYYAR